VKFTLGVAVFAISFTISWRTHFMVQLSIGIVWSVHHMYFIHSQSKHLS